MIINVTLNISFYVSGVQGERKKSVFCHKIVWFVSQFWQMTALLRCVSLMIGCNVGASSGSKIWIIQDQSVPMWHSLEFASLRLSLFSSFFPSLSSSSLFCSAKLYHAPAADVSVSLWTFGTDRGRGVERTSRLFVTLSLTAEAFSWYEKSTGRLRRIWERWAPCSSRSVF